MRWKKTICAWGMLFLGLMVSTGYGAEPPLLFGTLPVIQALPIFVAQQEGYFESAGVRVEVVPFKAALEKDVALTAGRIDGYFGDLFTPIVLKANGVDIRIVARNFLTGGGNRMFAILAGPREELTGAGDLAGIPVAVSSNTIIDYVTRFLLRDAGVPEDKIQVMETKNIPIRYQMLVSGQVKAATLPEPLVTLAETQGCRVLADDSRSQLSSTVLVFSNRSIQKREGEIRLFLEALMLAVERINSDPQAVRPIMIRHCHVPKPLRETFPVPVFPPLYPADPNRVRAALAWLENRGVIKTVPTYSQVVDDRFFK